MLLGQKKIAVYFEAHTEHTHTHTKSVEKMQNIVGGIHGKQIDN